MQHQPTSDWRGAQSHQWLLDWLARPRPGGPFPPGPVHEPPPDFQVDLIRPDDLLTLHVAGYNFKVVPDPVNPRLDRIDCTTDALLVATFPPQNIAETVNDIFTAASGFGFPSPSSRPAQAKPRLPQLITHYPTFATERTQAIASLKSEFPR
jgi:hypothetical protein